MERIDRQAAAGVLDETSRELIDAEMSLHPDPHNMELRGEERGADEIFADRLAKLPPAQHAAFLAYVAKCFGNTVVQRTLRSLAVRQ
jgi:hypothetical protein